MTPEEALQKRIEIRRQLAIKINRQCLTNADGENCGECENCIRILELEGVVKEAVRSLLP